MISEIKNIYTEKYIADIFDISNNYAKDSNQDNINVINNNEKKFNNNFNSNEGFFSKYQIVKTQDKLVIRNKDENNKYKNI
jgi:hypothetical protein